MEDKTAGILGTALKGIGKKLMGGGAKAGLIGKGIKATPRAGGMRAVGAGHAARGGAARAATAGMKATNARGLASSTASRGLAGRVVRPALPRQPMSGLSPLMGAASGQGVLHAQALGGARTFLPGVGAKLAAMRDEFQKIAASKTRSHTRPITAANLASRIMVDKSSGHLKTAGALDVGKKLIKSPGKLGVTAVGTVAAWETGKQALRDYQLGRAIRKQQRR